MWGLSNRRLPSWWAGWLSVMMRSIDLYTCPLLSNSACGLCLHNVCPPSVLTYHYLYWGIDSGLVVHVNSMHTCTWGHTVHPYDTLHVCAWWLKCIHDIGCTCTWSGHMTATHVWTWNVNVYWQWVGGYMYISVAMVYDKVYMCVCFSYLCSYWLAGWW